MANVLKMALQQAIVALWRRGWSFRRIADELGVHREGRQEDVPARAASHPLEQRRSAQVHQVQEATDMGRLHGGLRYPDLILWLLDGQRQYVSFIDPTERRKRAALRSSRSLFDHAFIFPSSSRHYDP